MITAQLTPRFIKRVRELPADEMALAEEKIELFRDPCNHRSLKVHKPHGRLKGNYAFSLTYCKRVIYFYMSKKVAVFFSIITHDEYE